MSRTQRMMIIPVTLALILLTAVIGVLLGTVSPHEWDVLLSRIQGRRIISVAPASNVQATLYMLNANQPTVREVMMDLHLSEQGRSDGSTSVSILLTSEMDAVEIPLDDSLALRMEFVPTLPYTDDELYPVPVISPIQVAER